jgi:integrase
LLAIVSVGDRLVGKAMSLFKPKNSKNWYFSVQVDGRQVRRSTGTMVWKEAVAISAAKMADLEENRSQIDSKLFSLTEVYLSMASGGFRGQAAIVRRWRQALGDVDIRNITRRQIEQHVKTLTLENGKPASPATKNRHLSVIKAILQQAVAWGEIKENPARGIRKEKEQERMRYLKRNELDYFLQKAPTIGTFQPLLRVAVETGMRRGELQNLIWSDVDFGIRVILVRHSKNKRTRIVPMTDNAEMALRQIAWGAHSTAKVFPDMRDAKLRACWLKTIKATGQEDLRFHDLRHTFAVLQRQAGVDLQTLQEIMGHRSIVVTCRYSKFRAEDWMEQTRELMNRATA